MDSQQDILLQRLAFTSYPQTDADGLDSLAAATPHLIVMLNADPVKYPEVLDNVVIVPEVLREFPADTFHVAYADLPASQRIAKRYGILKFPALLFLRQGEYVGIIAGLLDWPDIVHAFADKLTAPTRRPPSVGIAVTSASNEKGCA
jgi:hydrogenase-1 operon protein HyaE